MVTTMNCFHGFPCILCCYFTSCIYLVNVWHFQDSKSENINTVCYVNAVPEEFSIFFGDTQASKLQFSTLKQNASGHGTLYILLLKYM